MATVTVNGGTTDDEYKFTALATPLILNTGVTYTVGATNYYSINGGAITANPLITNVTYLGGPAGNFGDLNKPTNPLGQTAVGANFEFQTIAIPEPASSGLVAIGSAIALLTRKRRLSA